ncbi:hypothetical protein B0H16DRAFT_1003236 [Mycena metata]|uniref:Uncharacterized protein n=1 Tax=Mycena metata TaxID=1033252 RepID=A0AAD7NU62_9AGAR|nr:hypothetical protein B0H16DRAFT_1003236 [Mycena metata]
MLADRELMKLVNEGEKFGFCSSATTFFADVVTKIDSPSAASDLGRVFFVFKAPARLPPEEFSRELEGVVDRCLALPICQRVLVRHSMLVPSKIGTDLQDNDGLLRALGLPTPEAVVVIIAEVESPDDFAEFFTDEFLVKEVVKEVKDKFEFHLNGVCFLGSVESKVNDL